MNMGAENVHEIVDEVRKRFGITRKFRVEFKEDVPTAYINLKEDMKIVINPNFFSKLDEKGKIGLVGHEIGHYADLPFDAKTLIQSLFIAAREMGEDSGEEIRKAVNFFMDLIVNINGVFRVPEIAETYKQLYTIKPPTPLERILAVYYSEVTGYDFGKQELSKEEEVFKRELYIINPFTERKKLVEEELPKFIQIYKKIRGKFGPQASSFSEDFEMDEKEVKATIRRLIKEGKLKKEDIQNLPKLFPNIASNDLEANKFYYRSKSLNYDLNVEPLPLENSGGLYPTSYSKWQASDPLIDWDPYTSFGKLIPPIANKKVYEGLETYGEGKRLPPAIIVLDSSGSMPNPIEKESPAVIAAYVVARKYLSQGSEVAVINFSNKTLVWDFSKNLDEIEEGLITYQGGNTYLDVKKLRKIDKKDADVYVITDVNLNDRENLEEMLGYLNNRKGRSMIFWIRGDNPGDLRELMKKYPKIKFIEVTNPSVLPKIIIKYAH